MTTAGRPRTRGDCIGGPRPCRWTGCRHHLAVTSSALGARVRSRDPEALRESCALDVADRGGASPPAIAELMGLSETSVFEALASGLAKVRAALLEEPEA